MRCPVWWDWELELTPHGLKRMLDREFTEVDLRKMLGHRRRPWEIVVEPDEAERVLVVITAYAVVPAPKLTLRAR
jgi:hypothetical protein